MKTKKIINWVLQLYDIHSNLEEFQTLKESEKIEILQQELNVKEINLERLLEIKKEKEREERLKNLKIETAEKIYKKYSKEKQTMLLYSTLFLFIWKMLEDEEIRAKFSEKELELLWNTKNVFLDMEKFVKEYKKEKRKLN